MLPQMESPALAARGVPATDLADASIWPESKATPRDLQVIRLRRLCAVDPSMARALAPFVHGEAAYA